MKPDATLGFVPTEDVLSDIVFVPRLLGDAIEASNTFINAVVVRGRTAGLPALNVLAAMLLVCLPVPDAFVYVCANLPP